MKNQHEYLDVVALVLLKNEKVLVAQRPPGDRLAGKWEFPGGKIETGETPEQALCREIYEELGLNINVDRHFLTTEYQDINILLRLHAYVASFQEGTLKLNAHSKVDWVNLEKLLTMDFAPADISIAKCLYDEWVVKNICL